MPGCYLDSDLDGYGSNAPITGIDSGSDCNDSDDTIFPTASEINGDGIDQNCDGYDTDAMVPDFSLPDINPYSLSYGQTISVRDQLQKVSGWYFIKAT